MALVEENTFLSLSLHVFCIITWGSSSRYHHFNNLAWKQKVMFEVGRELHVINWITWEFHLSLDSSDSQSRHGKFLDLTKNAKIQPNMLTFNTTISETIGEMLADGINKDLSTETFQKHKVQPGMT